MIGVMVPVMHVMMMMRRRRRSIMMTMTIDMMILVAMRIVLHPAAVVMFYVTRTHNNKNTALRCFCPKQKLSNQLKNQPINARRAIVYAINPQKKQTKKTGTKKTGKSKHPQNMSHSRIPHNNRGLQLLTKMQKRTKHASRRQSRLLPCLLVIIINLASTITKFTMQ